ncbi:MAG: filamentous hemagglutinin N-terminal domain-containing protein, partial [Desulfatibacillum sp.]|nr:filamentous hemagglutinin N-terminal domain-containing protein [Desulfatibacillum sp.]
MASLSRKINRARMRKERFATAGGAGYRSLDRSLLRARRMGISLGGTLVLVSAAPMAFAGQGFTVDVNGNTTTYNQTDQNVYNRVDNYNIAADELHKYNQPNSDAIFVQRVIGQDPSSILGSLVANGQVWIMNASGVLLGADSVVNTAGFMATSLVMEEDDFFAGNYTLNQQGNGGYVINNGTILVKEGGYAVLAGASVVNNGRIQADLGQVVLASGTQATLDFNGDGLVNFALGDGKAAQITGPDGEALTTAVLNTGQVRANGGRILMTAQAAGNILDSVVNNQGVVEANTVVEREGEILLLGGDEGLVVNQGVIKVEGDDAGEDGGFVEMSGEYLSFGGGTVSALTVDGQVGTLLLDPTDVVIESGAGASGPTGGGGANYTWLPSDLEAAGAGARVTVQADRDIKITGLDKDIDTLLTTDDTLTMQHGITFLAGRNFQMFENAIVESTSAAAGEGIYFLLGGGYLGDTGGWAEIGTLTAANNEIEITALSGTVADAGRILIKRDVTAQSFTILDSNTVNFSGTTSNANITNDFNVTTNNFTTSAAITSQSGSISITANEITLANDLTTTSAAKAINIDTRTPGTNIGLGDAGVAGDLRLSDEEVDHLQSRTVNMTAAGGSILADGVDVDNTVTKTLNLNGAGATIGDLELTQLSGSVKIAVGAGAVLDDGNSGTRLKTNKLDIQAGKVGASGADGALDIDVTGGADSVTITTTGNGSAGDIYLRDAGEGSALATGAVKALSAAVSLDDFALSTTGTGAQTVSITAKSGHIYADDTGFDQNIGTDNIILATQGSAANIVFSNPGTGNAMLETTKNVTLTSKSGQVYDTTQNGIAVKADYLAVNAKNGVGTGSTGSGPFNVDVNSLMATSENAIYIREDNDVTVEGLETTNNTAEISLVANGNIVLNGDVDADTIGNVTLDSITGAISRTSGSIIGGLLTISAALGIGATGATGVAIHTNVATLDADNSATGDIVILETDALTVGSVAAVTNTSGGVYITTAGGMTVTQNITAGGAGAAGGDVVLTTTVIGQTITVNKEATITAGHNTAGAGTGSGGVTIKADTIDLQGSTGTGSVATLISFDNSVGATGFDANGNITLAPVNTALVMHVDGSGSVDFVTTSSDLADFITVNGTNGYLVIGDMNNVGGMIVGSSTGFTATAGTNVALFTNGNVSFSQAAGSTDLSTLGDVFVNAGGNITDTNSDAGLDISATDLVLNAGLDAGGAIGGAAANAGIGINVTTVDAETTNGGIYLDDITGAGGLTVDAKTNFSGNIVITGSTETITLRDLSTDAGDITVTNTGNDLVATSVVAGSAMTITLTTTGAAGDIYLDYVSSVGGTVNITAGTGGTAGAVLAAAADGAAEIIASNAQINAVDGVGQAAGNGPIDINADTINISNTGSGGVYIDVLDTNANGANVTINSDGAGDVVVTAGTAAGTLTFKSVDAENGNINLSSRWTINLATAGNIVSDSAVAGSHDITVTSTLASVILANQVISDDDVTITAAGFIWDNFSDNVADIIANTVTLQGQQIGLSTGSNTVDVDVNEVVLARSTNGPIYLNLMDPDNSNVMVTKVDANGAGKVVLRSTTGAGTFTYQSVDTENGTISIDSYGSNMILGSVAGVIMADSAVAGSSWVQIRNLAGNITVNTRVQSDGSALLSASGSITDNASDGVADIVAARGSVYGATGVGSVANTLDMDVDVVIQALADTNGIYLNIDSDHSSTGNVSVNSVDARGTGNVNIESTSGAGKVIYTKVDANSGSVTITSALGDIDARKVISDSGFGTGTNDITITATAGEIWLGNVFSEHDVAITAHTNVNDDDDAISGYTEVAAGRNLIITAGTAASSGYIGRSAGIDMTDSAQLDEAVDINPGIGVTTLTSFDGNIQVYQNGSMTVNALPTVNVSAPPGGFQILLAAGQALTVTGGFTDNQGNNIALGALSGDLTIAAGQTVQASTGSVKLYAAGSAAGNGYDVVFAGATAATAAQVVAGADVYVQSESGQILSAGTGTNITGGTGTTHTAVITAGSGIGAGTGANAIEINASVIDSESATGGIYLITQGTGGVKIDADASNTGDIDIAGSSNESMTLNNVDANNGAITVSLNAGSGDVVINKVISDSGAAGTNDVTITTNSGDILFQQTGAIGVQSDDLVTLTATGGNIKSDAGTASTDVKASDLVMTAGKNIGSVALAIQTQISNVEALYGTGGAGQVGLWLDNDGDLTVGGIGGMSGIQGRSSVSNAVLINADSVTVAESVLATKTAGGSAGTGIGYIAIGTDKSGGITINAGQKVQAAGNASATLILATQGADADAGDVTISGSALANSASGDATVNIDSTQGIYLYDNGIIKATAGAGAGDTGSVNLDAVGVVDMQDDILASGNKAYIKAYADGAGGMRVASTLETGVQAMGTTLAQVILDTTGGAGNVSIQDDVLAQASGTGASASILLDAGGSATITAAGSVKANTTNTSGNSTITIDAGGALGVTIAGTAQALAAAAGNDATVNIGTAADHIVGKVTINGSVKADAGNATGDNAVVNIYANDDVLVDGGSVVAMGGAKGSGVINIGGPGADRIAGKVDILNGATLQAAVGAGGTADLNIFATGNVNIINGAGLQAAVGSVGTGGAHASLDIGSSVASGLIGGSVKINGANVSVVGGSADTQINVYAAGDISIGATAVTSLQSLGATAANTLSGEDVFIGGSASTGMILATGAINATNTVTASGGTGIVLYKGGFVRSMGVGASNLTLNTTANSGDITIYGMAASSVGAGNATLTLNSVDNVTVDKGGAIGTTVTGGPGGIGSVDINAVGDVVIGSVGVGKVLSAGSLGNAIVHIDSTGGTSGVAVGASGSVTGTGTAGALVEIHTDQNVVVDGTVTATSASRSAQLEIGTFGTPIAGGIAINAGATVSASGAAATGTKVVLSAGGDISIDAPVSVADSVGTVNMSVITSNGNITTTAPGTLTATGANHSSITVNGGGATKNVTLGGNATAIANGLSGIADVTVQSAGAGSSALVTTGSMIAKGTGADF